MTTFRHDTKLRVLRILSLENSIRDTTDGCLRKALLGRHQCQSCSVEIIIITREFEIIKVTLGQTLREIWDPRIGASNARDIKSGTSLNDCSIKLKKQTKN